MPLSLDPQSPPLNGAEDSLSTEDSLSAQDSLVGKFCPCLSGCSHSFSAVCIQADAAQFFTRYYWYQIHHPPIMLISSASDPKAI